MAPLESTELLLRLRKLMKECKHYPEPLQAYLVPTTDSHSSEYLADHDERRAFICKFTGSQGSAVITHDHACLWTDGRYFLQASEQMDSSWTLMKDGLPDTPNQATWLINNLPPNSNVGVDPKVIPHNTWKDLQQQLEPFGHKLVSVDSNLIDLLWDNRPLASKNHIVPLEIEYTGQVIRDKVKEVRVHMKKEHASILILSALDEIAWLLNLRGSDVKYNPFFFSYVVVTPNDITLLVDINKVTPDVKTHFEKEAGDLNLKVAPYDTVLEVVKTSLETFSKGFVWVSNSINYSIASSVHLCRLKAMVTPPALMKLIKNENEIRGMKSAHIKDGVALCCYFAWLENAVKTETVTEISSAEKLIEFRKQQLDFCYPSFPTINGSGAHGAIIHYQANEQSDIPIKTDAMYLCDSGGQYKDGTTDVTRTFHFGSPTDYEKDCYTRVLKGQLKLARSIFPSKIKGNYLDSFAREFLWKVGLDYGHGTGHGVGSYLCVHEPPIGISYKPFPDDPGLQAGMILSNEPGYYEAGKFGIRIEDLVLVVPCATKNNFNDRGFLTFETITLAPKSTKLIKVDMLTDEEILQLNNYHQKCREILGPLLESQNQHEAKKWLWKETESIVKTKMYTFTKHL